MAEEQKIEFEDGATLSFLYEPPTLEQVLELTGYFPMGKSEGDELTFDERRELAKGNAEAIRTTCSGFTNDEEGGLDFDSLPTPVQMTVMMVMGPRLEADMAPKALAPSTAGASHTNRASRRRAARATRK